MDNEPQSSRATHQPAPELDARPKSKPKRWPVVLSAVIFVFLGMASLGLALYGIASYNDSYSHAADRLWSLFAMIAAGLIFLASIAAIFSIVLPGETIVRATNILLVLSLLSVGALIWGGFGMVSDAQRRGGDWGALGVAASFVFGIVFPALIGAALAAGGACLRVARSSRANPS